ncbi:MAG: hypothetical protein WCP80_08995, partial [Phycisphaerales bacterium]
MQRLIFTGVVLFMATTAMAQVHNKVLFDATKAQMAANADWVIDASTYNIGTGTGGAMTVGAGNEANPSRYPSPAQSGITSTTAETYWKGASSSWAVALVKQGFTVETLPVGARLTFGDATNAQDLSTYGIFITIEPNIKYTTAEKTAIVKFVAAGGGFFMVADHTSSDRNSDGFDSLEVLNDLVNSNGIASNVFGITFNALNYSVTSSYVSTLSTDPLLHGAAGAVAQMQYSAGTTMVVNNTNAKGSIFRTSSRSNSDVMAAYATYGAGKIAACGDSSPFDDGTGDTGDTLYNGWSAEVNGDHGQL